MRAPNKRAWDCVETPLSSESKTSRKACVGRWIGDISQCQGMFWHSCQDVPMGKSPNWIWEKLNSKETNYALTHSKRKVQMQVFRFCHASDKKVSERHILLNRKQICKFARQMNSEHFLAHSIWKVLDESQKKTWRKTWTFKHIPGPQEGSWPRTNTSVFSPCCDWSQPLLRFENWMLKKNNYCSIETCFLYILLIWFTESISGMQLHSLELKFWLVT